MKNKYVVAITSIIMLAVLLFIAVIFSNKDGIYQPAVKTNDYTYHTESFDLKHMLDTDIPKLLESSLPKNVLSLVDQTANKTAVYSFKEDYKLNRITPIQEDIDYDYILTSPDKTFGLLVKNNYAEKSVTITKLTFADYSTQSINMPIDNRQISFYDNNTICVSKLEIMHDEESFYTPVELYDISNFDRAKRIYFEFSFPQIYLEQKDMYFSGAVFDYEKQRFIVTAAKKEEHEDVDRYRLVILLFSNTGELISETDTAFLHEMDYAKQNVKLQNIMFDSGELLSVNVRCEENALVAPVVYDMSKDIGIFFNTYDKITQIRKEYPTGLYMQIDEEVDVIEEEPDKNTFLIIDDIRSYDIKNDMIFIFKKPVQPYNNNQVPENCVDIFRRNKDGQFVQRHGVKRSCLVDEGINEIYFNQLLVENDRFYLTGDQSSLKPFSIVVEIKLEEEGFNIEPIAAIPMDNQPLYLENNSLQIISNNKNYAKYDRDRQKKSFIDVAEYLWENKYSQLFYAGFPMFETINDISPDEIVVGIAKTFLIEKRVDAEFDYLTIEKTDMDLALRWFLNLINFSEFSTKYYNHDAKSYVIPAKELELDLDKKYISEPVIKESSLNYAVEVECSYAQGQETIFKNESFYFALHQNDYVLIKHTSSEL